MGPGAALPCGLFDGHGDVSKDPSKMNAESASLVPRPRVAYVDGFGGTESLRKRYAPIRVLWRRVIVRAAFDWVLYRDSPDLRQKKLSEEAHKWIFYVSNLWNSFDNVCVLADVPMDKIRAWVQCLTKDQVKKMEHMEREGRISLLLHQAPSDESHGDDQ
jgi:hypothetical protein